MIILTCPKSFRGLADEIQRRSLGNWVAMGGIPVMAGPRADIETIPVAWDYETHIVENSIGNSTLPLFSDLLEVVSPKDHPLLCYANADLLFPPSFQNFAVKDGEFYYEATKLPREFLIVGSRWDLSEGVDVEGDASGGTGWFKQVAKAIEGEKVELHDPAAMDFFIFPPSVFQGLRPAIVGRGGYDNALVAHCLRRCIPVIDVSREFPVLHQFHGHEHKKGGKKEVYLGAEAMQNRREHDIFHSPPNGLDADMVLDSGELNRVPFRCGVLRRCELTLRYRYGQKFLSYLFRGVQRIFKSEERAWAAEMEFTRQRILKKTEA